MLLILYLAVIRRQHLEISTLEIVFWFWSAGFMLDEVVGFNEQGFSLYIMSFWNVFDLGILALLFCYSCLRVWSVILTDLEQKLAVAGQAYDVLACCAVLLLPRLFSVLDHVQYFSQLLIAFRMMAADLLAISLLIIVCCSGFFVAFTFAFNTIGETPGEIVYDLFQMLMGFTPTAWAMWDRYNYAGRFILVCFMFISHFLVVTILVTVLTNSFMAVVQNADEEHQFLFAVNTISMVKSDALFAYIAPTNTFAWIIAPLRFVMPFRQFVKFNRTVIKATHFPVLLCIYLYERFCLSRTSWAYVASDFFDEEEDQDAGANTTRSRNRVFSSNRLVKEPSIATFRKDQALEEVFKKPYRYDDAQSTRSPNVFGLGIDLGRRSARNNTVNVDTWMETLPEENSSSVREFDQSNAGSKLARRRNSRNTTGGTPIQNFHRTYGTMRNRTETTRSVASDPEDLYSGYGPSPGITRRRRIRPPRSVFSGIPRPARHLSRRVDIEEDEDEQHQGDDEDEEGKEGRSELPDDDDDDDDGQEDRKGDGSRGDLDNLAKTDDDGKINSKVTEVEAMRSSDVENNEGELIRDVAASAPTHINLTSARTSRTSTIANASRHSSRPMTPREFIRKPQSLGSTKLASKEESQKGKDAELPAIGQNNDGEGFGSGSDGLGDETDDEGEASGSPVTMRAPLFRNAGTASGGLAGFDKRNKTNTTNSSRSGLDGGGGSGSKSTYRAKGPSRSREDTVSMASQAWAEDGSTAATSPMRRPTFKRTQSHPSRHLGSATPSELPVALDLASDLGDNKAIGGGLIGAVPASFATQMAYASGGLRRPPSMERNSSTQDLMSRLVLARMKTLEEGFQQVIKEVKDLKVRDERNARRDREREKRPEIDGLARPSHAPGLALGNTSPRSRPHLSQHQRLPASGAHKRHPSRRGKSAVAKGKENSS
ncbi:hypothetical protein KEM55_003018 [Ascosphaera atra]|nr:hypothetical protein KEM55_003018 [Ascosphaera atra]